MTKPKNYYRILHVQPDAPAEIIKASYRTLMQRLKQHPDLGGNHWNATQINEAYNVLRNPGRRAQYDRLLLNEEIAISVDQDLESHAFIKNYCKFCKTPHGYQHGVSPDALCNECQSPLFIPGIIEEANCNRELLRFDKNEVIYYYTFWPGTRYQGEIFNLSPKGISFRVHHDIEADQIVKIESESLNAIVQITNKREELDNHLYNILGARFLSVTFNLARGNFISTSI